MDIVDAHLAKHALKAVTEVTLYNSGEELPGQCITLDPSAKTGYARADQTYGWA
jgi:hypothetical protein